MADGRRRALSRLDAIPIRRVHISPGERQAVLFARLPEAIVSIARLTTQDPGDAVDRSAEARFIEAAEAIVARHRHEQAQGLGNVIFGGWAPSIYRHAETLLAQDETEAALAVLKQLVAWAPTHFEAQMAFAERAPDLAAARASAEAVWSNAENPALIAREKP